MPYIRSTPNSSWQYCHNSESFRILETGVNLTSTDSLVDNREHSKTPGIRLPTGDTQFNVKHAANVVHQYTIRTNHTNSQQHIICAWSNNGRKTTHYTTPR